MTTVELVRWPGEAGRRAQLDHAGRLRILVLEGGVIPPVCGPFEDWVRPPVSREDLAARVAVLRTRAAETPTLQGRLLSLGGHSLALTEGETQLVDVLLERFGEVVEREELCERLWADGPAPRRNALDLRVLRLRRRLGPLGLTVRTRWGQGYLLERTHDRPGITFAG